MLQIKRIYEPYEKDDGFRILVDRLWPRGISKEKARLDLWLKEVAPSTALRKWFGHEPKKWPEFKKRYKEELRENKHLVSQLKSLERKHGKVTLLYATRDKKHNEAVVLAELIKRIRYPIVQPPGLGRLGSFLSIVIVA